MNEEIFWKAVDDMGWEANGFDYDKIGKDLETRLWAEYGDQQAGEIATGLFITSMRVHNDLYKVVDKYARKTKTYMGGDDSFSDLLNHIIGLGKAEYDAVMADPSLAAKRYEEDAFTESFSYCFQDAHKRANGGLYDCREQGNLG